MPCWFINKLRKTIVILDVQIGMLEIRFDVIFQPVNTWEVKIPR